jgi:endonuclease I
MKRTLNQLTITVVFAVICNLINAQVENGDFEQWSGNTPVSWTTIDAGISTFKEQTIVNEGSNSLRVTVNTASQSSTDFRQTVSATSGETYTFSVWVRHTEGGMRARLYVNGYTSVYSNPSLVNQWQQISYGYTASSDQFEVGLRFYDVSGFDGSEIVYVDNFQPTTSGTPDPGACNDNQVSFVLTTDNYGSETSWELKNASGTTLYSGSGYGNNTSYNEEFCLPNGDYSFTINDSYGDGICCSYGNGSYSLSDDSGVLASGGNFSSTETKTFTVGNVTPPPPSCTETLATLNLTTDNYGSETSWQLTNSSGTVLYTGSGYSSNSNYNEEFCLSEGDYTFTINDSYGDGICCSYGNGSYAIVSGGNTLVSGGSFTSVESKGFTIGSGGGDPAGYYASAAGKSGYTLKTALYHIIKSHSSQGYSALWTFYKTNEIDNYYENDGTILDIYSENPNGTDPYTFVKTTDQCGTYSGEGDCYNREHSFPRSWFGGSYEPMNSDVHHIFASDGKVNSVRGSYPYGIVGNASYTSQNGSKLGSMASGYSYSGTVFEPIDEFKGDIARAHLYMATRYENVIAGWEGNSTSSNAVLNGTSNQVFESWMLDILLLWHENDPVSTKEINRNEAAYAYQGNRNPFVDHPEFVESIWGSSSLKSSILSNEDVIKEEFTVISDKGLLHVVDEEARIEGVKVYHVSGKLVYSKQFIELRHEVSVFPSLESGTYIILLETTSGNKKAKHIAL